MLIVAATATFIVGVAIERGDEGSHHEVGREEISSAAEAEEPHSEAGEREGQHTDSPADAGTGEESHEELRPLGIDVEAWPFVTLAALTSLALAAAGWLRSGTVPSLVLIAAAMLAFAALDVREVVHQLDIDETALAVLAGVVAALHAAAALVAAAMASHARNAPGGSPGAGATMTT